MALRIRRGLDIERQSIIPAEGEPLYCTDTGMLYIGDGSSVGGQLVTGIKSLLDDPTPTLAAPLDLNSHAIVGMGDINIVGDLTVSGNLNIDAVLSDYRGSLYGNDSTLIIDGNNHLVHASVAGLAGELLVDVNTGEINLEYSRLQSLQDVDDTLPMVGSTLTWEGTQWIPSIFGSDAGITPSHGAILQYDTTVGWSESTFITANDSSPMFNLQTGEFFLGQTNLDSIGNVYIDMNTLQPDHILTWDGMNWTHKEITIDNVQFLGIDLDSLQNVYTPNPAKDDVLQWDGNMWTNVPMPDPVTQNPVVRIGHLENVFLNAPAYGHVLTFDGTNWVNLPIPDTELNGLTDVSINLVEVGDVLAWRGSQWENVKLNEFFDATVDRDYIGSFQGSVVGFDSSLIIDADRSIITADRITADNIITENITAADITADNITIAGDITAADITADIIIGDARLNSVTISTDLTCEPEVPGEFNANITGNDDNSVLRLNRKFVNTSETDTTRLGIIKFSSIDATSNLATHGQIDGRKGYIWLSSSLAADYVDTTNTAHLFLDGSNGCIGVGKRSASYKLDVEGEIVSSSYIQFGNLTTTERNNLTALNGMVIYNTTNNKFEGYQNGTWINIDDGQPAT